LPGLIFRFLPFKFNLILIFFCDFRQWKFISRRQC
jgi:hypothetical protein